MWIRCRRCRFGHRTVWPQQQMPLGGAGQGRGGEGGLCPDPLELCPGLSASCRVHHEPSPNSTCGFGAPLGSHLASAAMAWWVGRWSPRRLHAGHARYPRAHPRSPHPGQRPALPRGCRDGRIRLCQDIWVCSELLNWGSRTKEVVAGTGAGASLPPPPGPSPTAAGKREAEAKGRGKTPRKLEALDIVKNQHCSSK